MKNTLYDEIDRLKKVNGELLEACKAALVRINLFEGHGGDTHKQINAAIQNAEVKP